jgi:Glycosyl transferase family 11
MRPTCSEYDAIVQLSGGLGNQLFQYAFGMQLALAHNLQVGYDVAFYRREQCVAHNRLHLVDYGFDIPLLYARPNGYVAARRLKRLPAPLQQALCGLTYVKCPASRFAPPPILDGLTYYMGLWQSPRYFERVADTVRDTFRQHLNDAAACSLVDHQRTVGFHVRRGDYLTHKQSYNVDYQAYLSAALERLAAETERSDWLVSVYSDDPDWCEANLSAPNLEINRGAGMLGDLLALMNCEHKIISNSTFAWWAAFLGERPGSLTYAPSRWHAASTNDEAQILCEGWRAVDA